MEKHILAAQEEAAESQRKEVNVYEEGLSWWQKFGTWLWRGVMALVTVFSGGVAYAVWMGENATDTEVEKAIEETVTQQILPAHEEAAEFHTKIDGRVEKIEIDMKSLDMTQRILDKRSEYQFELGRWQAKVLEAERKRKKPPKKPDRIDELERELMGFGNSQP